MDYCLDLHSWGLVNMPKHFQITGDTVTGNSIWSGKNIYTGELTLSGTGTVFDDLRIEPTVRVTGTRSPSFTQILTVSGSQGIYLYTFDNALAVAEKEIMFNVQMPHSWKVGSAIGAHVHWMPTTAENNAAVRWGLEYRMASIGETFINPAILYSSTNTAGDVNLVQYKHYITPFSHILPQNYESDISAILLGRIFRNSSHADDTFTGEVGILSIDIHYEIDTMGSRDEYSK